MNWTHDDELERRVLELRIQHKEQAVCFAVAQLMKLERKLDQLQQEHSIALRQLAQERKA